MAFANTAATIGHNVTLFDRADQIGGQFNMAKRIPGKEEFHETIRYFSGQLNQRAKEGKLNIQLGTEMTYDEMDRRSNSDGRDRIDKWIVATGVDPRVPNIPGLDHPNVLSYIDVLRNKAKVGQRVAVIGAGGIGFDVSEYLLHYDDGADHDKRPHEVDADKFLESWGVDRSNSDWGGLAKERIESPRREIILMQRKKGKLGAGLGKTTGWIHRSTLLRSKRVEMIPGVSYDKVDENGHLHVTIGKGKEKHSRVIAVDNIILCAGQVSHRTLEDEAKQAFGGLASKVFTIGGTCVPFISGDLIYSSYFCLSRRCV